MPAKKPFPLTTFRDALSFAQGIYSLGADGPIKRLTLLNELGKRPGSSKTRDLITHSSTYGLTKGSYAADFIELTDDGRVAVDGSNEGQQRQKHFELAIARIDPFNKIFEKYKGKSMPNVALLKDALEEAGVSSGDTDQAMSTLQENLAFVGAITDVSGKPHIDFPSFDSLGATDGEARPGNRDVQTSEANIRSGDRRSGLTRSRPSNTGPQLHIDVQVHIDSSATAEQIDQIFKSMAIHLYGNGHG